MAAYLFGLALVSSYARSNKRKPLLPLQDSLHTRHRPVSSDGSHSPLTKMQSSSQFGRGTDGQSGAVRASLAYLRAVRL